MSLAAFIADQRTSHDVPHAVACRALVVSESWFYKWNHRQRHRAPTPTEQRRAELDVAVAEAFEAAHGLHGSPRIHADLRAAGWVVSEKTVATSMARQGLVARTRKRPPVEATPSQDARPWSGNSGVARSSSVALNEYQLVIKCEQLGDFGGNDFHRIFRRVQPISGAKQGADFPDLFVGRLVHDGD